MRQRFCKPLPPEYVRQDSPERTARPLLIARECVGLPPTAVVWFVPTVFGLELPNNMLNCPRRRRRPGIRNAVVITNIVPSTRRPPDARFAWFVVGEADFAGRDRGHKRPAGLGRGYITRKSRIAGQEIFTLSAVGHVLDAASKTEPTSDVYAGLRRGQYPFDQAGSGVHARGRTRRESVRLDFKSRPKFHA